VADGEGGADLEQLLADMRPRLHRYCARMVGSAFDGEDVVQDALARAAIAYGPEVREPERWLIRIAHNAALDALRRRRRLAARQAQTEMEAIADASAAADVRVAAEASLAVFLALPPLQRSTVILGDVLGHPMAEMTEILGVTDASAKAALHRGRAALRKHAGDVPSPRSFSPRSGRACGPTPTASTPATSTPCAPCLRRTCASIWPTEGRCRVRQRASTSPATARTPPPGPPAPAWPRAGQWW
jgi:RNA polymerase sigma factor (sigma-70 family)